LAELRIRDCESGWGIVTQVLHWLTAFLVASLAVLGVFMVDLPTGLEKLQFYEFHKSLGLLVFAITAVRLIWRRTGTAPRLRTETRQSERVAAAAVHGLLYIMLLALPLSGWLMSSAAAFPVRVFGWFPVPALTAPDRHLADLANAAHTWLAVILALLLVLHTAAGTRHQLIRRDDSLRRMIPIIRSRRSAR
jgi:cytochrome b561